MQQWGDRIQCSVSTCVVTPQDPSELVGRVEQMFDPAPDVRRLRRMLVPSDRSRPA
ncbi:MAG: hypothetical protein ACRDTF_21275 [Pseudonocardiaceae bacterium]